MPAFLPDVHDVREDFNDYLGECVAFDAGLGVIIERLEAIGELDNTPDCRQRRPRHTRIPQGKVQPVQHRHRSCPGSPLALSKVSPGRVVTDFVNLMDLAPTFLDAAGVDHPGGMAASSIIPLLESTESGRIQEYRDFIVTGRERHTESREGALPYPIRAIRTDDFLYIHNFEPDRWPAGDPGGLDDVNAEPPPWEDIRTVTLTVYGDLDQGPTKVWMIYHRAEEDVKPLFELGFGKRLHEELYDLRNDPDYMQNVAYDSDYEHIRADLNSRLISVLKEQDDPRIAESPPRFEQPPYAGPASDEWHAENMRWLANRDSRLFANVYGWQACSTD